MVGKTELILICLVAIALLAIAARKIRVAYPILLTIRGLIRTLISGLPPIQLDPQLVFNLFLPPLICPAAVFTSWRDFRANLRPIFLLANRPGPFDDGRAGLSVPFSGRITFGSWFRVWCAQLAAGCSGRAGGDSKVCECPAR